MGITTDAVKQPWSVSSNYEKETVNFPGRVPATSFYSPFQGTLCGFATTAIKMTS